jgi:hypothetical protein
VNNADEQARLLGIVDAEAARRAARSEAPQDDADDKPAAPAMVEVPVRDVGEVYMSAEAAVGLDDRYWSHSPQG